MFFLYATQKKVSSRVVWLVMGAGERHPWRYERHGAAPAAAGSLCVCTDLPVAGKCGYHGKWWLDRLRDPVLGWRQLRLLFLVLRWWLRLRLRPLRLLLLLTASVSYLRLAASATTAAAGGRCDYVCCSCGCGSCNRQLSFGYACVSSGFYRLRQMQMRQLPAATADLECKLLK